MKNEEDISDTAWLGFEWSPWLSLGQDKDELSSLSADSGVYRVRHPAYEGLIYIGETGRSIRGRLYALAGGIFAEEMPYSDPHTGSPCLWSIADKHGPGFEASAATPPEATEKGQRKAIEDALIAVHRRDTQTNLVGNFGRMPPGYKKSKMRSTGVRGGKVNDEPLRDFQDGIDPLPWENPKDLTDPDWMGLAWSKPEQLADVGRDVPAVPGHYRIWDPTSSPPLEYVGQSVNIRSRLRTHRRNRDGGLRYAFVECPDLQKQFKRQQAESTLLGAHWLACASPPRDQY